MKAQHKIKSSPKAGNPWVSSPAEPDFATPYMTQQEAAEYLKVCDKTLFNLRKSGQVPHFFLGKLVRFRRDDLDQWIARRIQYGGQLDAGASDASSQAPSERTE